MTIKIKLNGEDRTFDKEVTISELLSELDLKPEMIVVERNLEIVKRSEFDKVSIEDNDTLEVLHFVGGGQDELETVFETNDDLEIRLARDVLDENGIEAIIDAEAIREVYNITVDGIGKMKLKVLKTEAMEAREILDDWVENRGDISEE